MTSLKDILSPTADFFVIQKQFDHIQPLVFLVTRTLFS